MALRGRCSVLAFLLSAFFLSALMPGLSYAAAIEVGKPLPAVLVQERGELLLKNDEELYRPWNSQSLRGKLVVLQHMAARLTAKSQMQKFNDEMERRAYPPQKLLVAVVVNLDDALWGTTGLVESELTGNKKKHPESNIVPDKKGVARQVWELQPKGAALTLLDANGTVIFFKEGKLNSAERAEVFGLIESRLQPPDASAAVSGTAQ